MRARKELNTKDISNIVVKPIFSETEIISRHDDYINMSEKDFDNTYKDRAFMPVVIDYGTGKEEIQYNFCVDTFCTNYAMPVETIIPRGARSIKNYKFSNAKDDSRATCNIMNYVGSSKSVFNNHSALYSNWSIADEIKRLSIINSVVDEIAEYEFHAPTCTETYTPFDKTHSFIKFGKTKAGAPRYKCKICGKTTAIKPSTKQRHSYNQQRSDVIIPIFTDIISRTPISQICNKLYIAPTTFYDKVEFVYKKCLEFLERHEAKLPDVQFNNLYLCSDTFTYSLNNIRRKGKGGKKQTREGKRHRSHYKHDYHG